MTLLITGANGFLGRHVRLALDARGETPLVADRDNWQDLPALVANADRIIHLAGINRGEDTEVREGNVALANDLITACDDGRKRTIVFANTIHAGRADAYGTGKQAAGELLEQWQRRCGGKFVNVALPNLFGEEGRPFYNSVVATFVEQLTTGQSPHIGDGQVPLLHAQQAARILIDAADNPQPTLHPRGTDITIAALWQTLARMHTDYRDGVIPHLSGPLDVPLFNTLRARMFRDRPAIELQPHSDRRGMFVETAKVRGGGGQTSFSTTAANVTRGQHYHLRKIERFVVIAGTGRMQLRHVLDGPETTVTIDASGDRPLAVDMPTGWAHNITNIGSSTLLTQFWINEVYDPNDPDTFAKEV